MRRHIQACGVFLSLLSCVWGQSYTISTVAGSDRLREGDPALTVPLRGPNAVVVDSKGNVFISDRDDYRVRKVAPSGTMRTYVGVGHPDWDDSTGPAAQAAIAGVMGMAIDGANNLYIADWSNSLVRKIDISGLITTVAGEGSNQYSGDGGAATSAGLDPSAVAVDKDGNLYIADYGNNRIRKVTPTGIISTFAGNGSRGYSGDGGPATTAQISDPTGVAVDPAGNVYFTDYHNNRIRKVTAAGIISTVGGNGSYEYAGDGGPATAAQFDPVNITVDSAGNLYIADWWNNRVRKITANNGVISTVAGNGNFGFGGDGGPATAAILSSPSFVSVGPTGALYIADEQNDRVREVTPDGTISTVAGAPVGDGGPATDAFLNHPAGVAIDAQGNLYISDSENHRVRRVALSGAITTFAGLGPEGFNEETSAAQAALDDPLDIALDAAGNLYIADALNSRIQKVTPNGTISTFAGNGTYGLSGDGGLATVAEIGLPTSVTTDAAGNVYFADLGFYRIRKVTPAGIISTIAGNGSPDFVGDSGPATAAGLVPMDIAADSAGNLYVADEENYRIRKIDTKGMITTVAGNGKWGGLEGDGGPATSASLARPSGVAVDADGNLYIADYDHFVVRRVSKTGIITTVAGKVDGYSYAGDGMQARAAQLDPFQLAVDSKGNVFVADRSNDRIRKLTLQTPVALSPSGGNNQTGAPGTQLATPLSVTIVDGTGIPVANVTVTFAVTAGTATLNPASAVTGGDGVASTQVTLGNNTGAVTITATATGMAMVTFNLTAATGGGSQPALMENGVRSVANGAILNPPGSLIYAQGTNLASTTTKPLIATVTPLPMHLKNEVDDVSVTVNGFQAPMYYALPSYVSFQLPWGTDLTTGTATMVVTRNGVASAPVQFQVTKFSPGIFTTTANGSGSAWAIFAATSKLNPKANVAQPAGSVAAPYVGGPATVGDTLYIYAGGLGPVGPKKMPDGNAPCPLTGGCTGYNASDYSTTSKAVVMIGSGTQAKEALVTFAGLHPVYPGLYLVYFKIPSGVQTGDAVPIQLQIGTVATTESVTIAIQ